MCAYRSRRVYVLKCVCTHIRVLFLSCFCPLFVLFLMYLTLVLSYFRAYFVLEG